MHCIAQAKHALRQAALVARAGGTPHAGCALAKYLLRDFPPPAGAVVAGFWPLPDEIDIRPVLNALHGRGHQIVLPETPPRGRPLIFHRWTPGDALLPGRFGTQHPAGDPADPDWLLVPLLAFDSAGNRLGYGAGYYDRTLAGLPGRIAVGCAFAAQHVGAVPVDATDARLDAIATERGIITPGRD